MEEYVEAVLKKSKSSLGKYIRLFERQGDLTIFFHYVRCIINHDREMDKRLLHKERRPRNY